MVHTVYWVKLSSVSTLTSSKTFTFVLSTEEVDVLGDDALTAVRQDNAVLHGVLNIEQEPRLCFKVTVVYEGRTSLQHVRVALPHKVDGSFQKWMSWHNQCGQYLPLDVAIGLIEADSLIAPLFAGADFAVHAGKRFYKVRLELVNFHTFHVLADCHDLMDVHRALDQGVFVKKHPQGFALLFQFLEEPLKHHALVDFPANKIPQLADLRLPTVVGVPRRVVVHHQMRPLEVDAFTCGVGGDEVADFLILFEQFLDLALLVAEQTAVYGHNRFLTAEQRADFVCQVAKCVAVFREDNQLFVDAVRSGHIIVVLEQSGEFIPLTVYAALPDVVCHALRPKQCFYFRFKFSDSLHRRCLVSDLLFGILQFCGGHIVIVVGSGCECIVRSPLAQTFLGKAAFKPLVAAFQRLVDDFWRRSQSAALQYGQGEVDGSLVLVIQLVSSVEFLLYIFSYSGAKLYYFDGFHRSLFPSHK